MIVSAFGTLHAGFLTGPRIPFAMARDGNFFGFAKRIIVYLLFLHACIALAPSAWATWGRFVSTGTATGVGNPSCALVSTGCVACAVRNAQAAIMVNHFRGQRGASGQVW